MTPTTPLNSVDLPAPFGPTTAVSEPASHRAVEMMHGRMAVVAQRQIAELQLRGHRHRPEHREPDQRDRHRGHGEALDHRHPQDGGMHRGRRMNVARVTMVMMVAMVMMVGHSDVII